MQTYRTPGFFVCLSAFLSAFGTYLATVEVPVRITYDPTAADQYDLLRGYLPIGFALWILALLFLVYGAILGLRKPLGIAQLRKPFWTFSLIVAVILGVLTLASTFLPWVIAEKPDPFIEIRGVGTHYVGQYHALTGVSLMTAHDNRVGDVMYLVLVGAIIAFLHIPLLARLEKERMEAMRAFLFSLSGLCIIGPILSIYTHEIWWVGYYFAGGSIGGAFRATFESSGIGLLIAAVSAAGLIATIKLARQREHLVNL